MAGITDPARADGFYRPTFSHHLFSSQRKDGVVRAQSLPRASAVAMTFAPAFSSEAIRETFQAWNAERESLDTDLTESIAALEAYQQNLDDWHRQLAREREELQAARACFEHDRISSENAGSEKLSATVAELSEAREKITALTTLLLSRTEELRTLDNRRSEIQTELELARAKERELQSTIEDQAQYVEQERSHWAEELRQLREAIERQLETSVSDEAVVAVELSKQPQLPPAPVAVKESSFTKSPSGGSQSTADDSPLLGSIVEQFGKLRQQRAVGRQSQSKQK